MACEATLQPIRRFGVDAAILFSDIMVPLLPAVPGLDFAPGPKLPEPVHTVDGLAPPEAVADVEYVYETVRRLRREDDPVDDVSSSEIVPVPCPSAIVALAAARQFASSAVPIAEVGAT